LKALSDKLKIHPNKLSRLINKHHKRNFNEHVKKFHLDYFKEIPVDEKKSHLMILGLAFESGF